MCPFKVVSLCKVVTLFGPLENFLRGNRDMYITYVCVHVYACVSLSYRPQFAILSSVVCFTTRNEN